MTAIKQRRNVLNQAPVKRALGARTEQRALLLILCIVIGCITTYSANADSVEPSNIDGTQTPSKLDLLNTPSVESELATDGVLLALQQGKDSIIAVGERGHIVNWQDQENWLQEISPVAVTLTDITQLPDQSFIAVGHDGAIIKREPSVQTVNPNDIDGISLTSSWRKVFDGYALNELLIQSLERQLTLAQARLDDLLDNKLSDKNTSDEVDIYDLEYFIEDLHFAIEDAELEKAQGPNKPLLGVAATQDKVFAVGAYGILLVSQDNGETWSFESQLLDNPDKFHLNDVVTTEDGHVFIVGENGLGFVSDNNGISFETMQMPYSGSYFGIAKASDSKYLLAYGLKGNIALSQDHGQTWRSLKSPTQISILGGFIDGQQTAYLVGHAGVLLHFSLNTPEQITVKRHPSGASLAAASYSRNTNTDNRASEQGDTQLIVVGQYGIDRIHIRSTNAQAD
uniref:WD40/YVTN/BNR-like repeat-containing protein n=1 Tax=Ningiella ruwaisensis TaxID=2364274 RepID=UPI00109FE0EF|nr:sialidase [Ningiella ruwaisensis]